MATIHPFRALRPVPARAAAVSSVPYDVVTTEEARELARNNPFSFLRVTRSEIDLPPDADPYAARVYQRARENFQKLRETAPLVVEDAPSLYFYRLKLGQHEQTGLAGCFSVDEYERDIIKKHERTRRDKEDDRTRHIIELRAQTGIVFLVYRAVQEVDAVTRRVTATEPLDDFTAEDGVQHTVWRVEGEDTRTLVASFGRIPSLYIADGHHRAASAARARDEMRGRPGVTPEVGTFIAVAFPDDQVKILPYNRTVKDLAGRTAAQFLKMLRDRLPVTDGSATPGRKGEVGMYLGGKWYSIDLTRAQPEDASRGSSLDVALLQRAVLEQLLSVGDVRTDKRIDFIGGARGTRALEQAVDTGKAAVAFSLFPVTIDDLMAISDAGGIMPPKSTWFEPKLRDGLLVHLI
ncbi:MAG: DUF1015 family protein [Vicinamibacterales bacterium]